MRWRWSIWFLCVVAWTWALLLPNPGELARVLIAPGAVNGEAKESFRLQLLSIVQSELFSKILHVTAYAALTVLSGWVGRSRRQHCWLLVFLSLHAFGTELSQGLIPTRHPSLRDEIGR